MLNDSDLLRDVALFVGVATAGSFSRAAQQLQMPVSTLSRRIKLMEQGLGLNLLTRSGRRIGLTDAGQRYLQRCDKLITEVRLAQAEFEDQHDQARGLLRVALPVDFGLGICLPLVQEFARLHPSIELHLDLSPTIADVAGGDVDVALRLGVVRQPLLLTRSLGQIQRSLFASPSYLASRSMPEHPQNLRDHRCLRVLNQSPAGHWELIDSRSGDQVNIDVAGQCSTNNMSMLTHLALAGLGIALLPDHLCSTYLATQQLCPVLPNWHPVNMSIQTLTSSRNQPRRVKLFVNFLVENMNATKLH